MRVALSYYNGIPQVINKDIQEVAKHENGSFNQPYSLMTPKLRLTGTFGGNSLASLLFNGRVNYVKVSSDPVDGQLSNVKYYYITDYEFLHNGDAELTLHLDVLMTYKSQIEGMEVMLERSSESGDDDIIDNMMPVTSKNEIEKVKLSDSFSEEETQGTYVLITSQNGYSPVG